jgi:hypothetical protein
MPGPHIKSVFKTVKSHNTLTITFGLSPYFSSMINKLVYIYVQNEFVIGQVVLKLFIQRVAIDMVNKTVRVPVFSITTYNYNIILAVCHQDKDLKLMRSQKIRTYSGKLQAHEQKWVYTTQLVHQSTQLRRKGIVSYIGLTNSC